MKQLNNQAAAPDEPERLEPIPETYAGHNNPYRGIEMHGVAPEHDAVILGDMAPELATRDAVIDYEEVKEVEPVPVLVVNQSQHELRRFRAAQGSVSGDRAQRVVGRQEGRYMLSVANLDAALTLYVGSDNGVSALTGFPVEARETHNFTHEDEMWIIAASGTDQISYAYCFEYSVRE